MGDGGGWLERSGTLLPWARAEGDGMCPSPSLGRLAVVEERVHCGSTKKGKDNSIHQECNNMHLVDRSAVHQTRSSCCGP